MRGWGPLVGSRSIITRLVLAVAAAMTLVLAAGAAFVFWRVSVALSDQLDNDLSAYREVAESAVESGQVLVEDTPGQSYQVYDLTGSITGGDATRRLVPAGLVREVAAHGSRHGAVGHLLRPSPRSYRYVVARTPSPSGPVVVAYAISRHDHDEALRELLLQLLIADLATLVAASYVGYRTARGALNPVERYRRAAASAGEQGRLPVGERDDELSRLGHTFNELLDRIASGAARERQFLADASHELRSPLTVMRAEVEWALMRPADVEANRETLESLGSQVTRMVTLCNALLDLEELRADPEPIEDVVSLADAAFEVAARWRHRVAEAGRELVIQVPEDLVVHGHLHWLDLALDNLVSNALRYGSGSIALTGERHGDQVLAMVEDQGPGFPADFVGRAFDRFARAEESRASGGTGLGLALVAAVAETHGGSVSIRGSRVTLSLPFAR